MTFEKAGDLLVLPAQDCGARIVIADDVDRRHAVTREKGIEHLQESRGRPRLEAERALDPGETKSLACPHFSRRVAGLNEKLFLPDDLSVLHVEHERRLGLAESGEIDESRVLIEGDVILVGLLGSNRDDGPVANS